MKLTGESYQAPAILNALSPENRVIEEANSV